MSRPTWLDVLVGRELRAALEVEVHFPNEEPLTTGDLVLETDRVWLQLVAAASERRIRTMTTPGDVDLVGDWSDRSGVILRPTTAVDVPFVVRRVHYAQRGAGLTARDTIGAWLLGDGDAVRMSLLVEPEDATMGPPEILWSYLRGLAPRERAITLYGP